MIPVPFEEHYQVPASAIDTDTIATREYVDATLQNLDWKNSVKAITAAALAAYTRVGNVITANANGALAAVNGITLSADDRMALKDGAAGADNGIYSVTQVGSADTPFILTRTTDADSSDKFTARLAFEVEQGTNAGLWHCTNTGTITLNTTSITIAQLSGGASLTTDVADIQPLGTRTLGNASTAAPANHIHAIPAIVLCELRTTTNVVPSTRRWGFQGALTTSTTNVSIALGRIKLPAGTYTLTGMISAALAAGQNLAISVYSCATANGSYAEATAGSGATITFVDTDLAEAERSVTFTLSSAAWVMFSTLYSSGTFTGYIVAQIKTG